MIFFKLIILIECSDKDSHNFFMQSLPTYKSCLFFIPLNDDIADIRKSERIC